MVETSERLYGVTGIYGVIHRDTGRVYVGQATCIGRRLRRHRCEARGVMRSRSKFHSALRKHGEAAFDVEVLDRCTRDQLMEREKFYIQLFNAVDDGLNLAAEPTRSRFGVPQSAESKAKQSASTRGKPHSAAHNAAVLKSIIGRKMPDSQKAKLRAHWLGTTRSPEICAKISAGQLKPVVQMDMSGKVIREFRSPTHAAIELGKHRSTIASAANGNSKHAYGFRWAYKEDQP